MHEGQKVLKAIRFLLKHHGGGHDIVSVQTAQEHERNLAEIEQREELFHAEHPEPIREVKPAEEAPAPKLDA